MCVRVRVFVSVSLRVGGWVSESVCGGLPAAKLGLKRPELLYHGMTFSTIRSYFENGKRSRKKNRF